MIFGERKKGKMKKIDCGHHKIKIGHDKNDKNFDGKCVKCGHITLYCQHICKCMCCECCENY